MAKSTGMKKCPCGRIIKEVIITYGGGSETKCYFEYPAFEEHRDQCAECGKLEKDYWGMYMGLEDVCVSDVDALYLAQAFHDIYERLAPSYGYETREDTREFDPESDNGMLMVAVCQELIDGNYV